MSLQPGLEDLPKWGLRGGIVPHREPPSGPDALGCFYALLTEKEGEGSSRGWEDNFFLN